MFPQKKGAPDKPSRERSIGRRNGFALVTVIWGLSLITLLIVTFASAARLRLQTAYNISGAAQAGLFADAAINMAILSLLSEQSQGASNGVHDGKPVFCAMRGVAVAIAIEDESGKVDLNAATPEILKALFSGLGLQTSAASALADAIVDFRTPPGAGGVATGGNESNDLGRPFRAKHARFDSTLELDQVARVDPALFSTLNRSATIYSFRPGINARAAPPALFAALAGFSAEDVGYLLKAPFPNKLDRNDGRFPQNFKSAVQGGGNPTFLVHAETLAATGQTGVKEAIVDFRAVGQGAFVLRELRSAAPRHLDQLRAVASGGGALPNCEP